MKNKTLKMVAILCFTSATLSIHAQTDSSYCGDELTYSVSDNGKILTIQGVGDMYDFMAGMAPWYKNASDLTTISLPNGLTYIGSNAFYSCSKLASANIVNGVTKIGVGAFQNCTSLTSVTIPNSVTEIDDGAFMGCDKLTNALKQEQKIIRIGIEAFYGCAFTSITLPVTITSIDTAAFAWCNELTSVVIPDNTISKLEYGLFSGCRKMATFSIPNGVTAIGDYAFHACSSLNSVSIPNSVTIIGEYAFYECESLTSLTIPDNTSIIGGWAFGYCNNLSNVVLGKGIMQINDYAFLSCKNLKTLVCEAVVPPALGYFVFEDINEDAILFVPEQSLSDYSSAEQWKDFARILPIGSPEAISNTNTNTATPQKLLRDGQILILRGDKTYTLTGQEVR